MNLIAKHLDTNLISDKIKKGIDGVCAFTGIHISEGILLSDVVSKVFTDYEYVKYPSDYVSVDIAKTILPIIQGNNGLNSLRVYSFLATDNQFKLLKTEEFMDVLISPPEPPFIFCINFSNKKHIAYKSRVNYSREEFFVSTDKGNTLIEKNKLSELLEVSQRWYTVIPGKENTSTQPTFFTKEEIFGGHESINRIREFGINQFIKDVKILEKYRGTLFAEVVRISLKKSFKTKLL